MATPGPDPTVADSELIEAIEETIEETGCPVAGTTDIVERVGMTGQGVRRRVNRLAENGRIERKKIGGSAVIYWLPEDDDPER